MGDEALDADHVGEIEPLYEAPVGGQQRAAAQQAGAEADAGDPQPREGRDQDVQTLARVVAGHRHDQRGLATLRRRVAGEPPGGATLAEERRLRL